MKINGSSEFYKISILIVCQSSKSHQDKKIFKYYFFVAVPNSFLIHFICLQIYIGIFLVNFITVLDFFVTIHKKKMHYLTAKFFGRRTNFLACRSGYLYRSYPIVSTSTALSMRLFLHK